MALTQPTLFEREAGGVVSKQQPKGKGGDHRRKVQRRALPPATVRVSPGCIEVVVPDVLGKNESCRGGRVNGGAGARFLSPATRKYRESVRVGVLAHADAIREGLAPHDVPFICTDGAWRLEVLGVWPTENHVMGIDECPRGDVDAPISQALDALMHAGILDDDARVREVRAWNMYRKGERWTVIRLVRVPDIAERDAAIAHLVAMLPPPSEAAQVPATAKRKRGRKAPAAC